MLRLSLIVLAWLIPLRTLTSAEPESPKHLADLQKLVKALEHTSTKYEHGAGSIEWGDRPNATCDCSSLMIHLWKHTYGSTENDIKAWFVVKRPTARRFHDAINDGKIPAWKKINKLKDAKPGDLIVMKYTEAKPGDDTGHVMMIEAAPEAKKEGPTKVENATTEWHIKIIDSTSSPHGKADSRYDPATKNTGVGRGVFRIYTDKDGDVAAYTWSAESDRTLRKPDTHHLVIGRFVKE